MSTSVIDGTGRRFGHWQILSIDNTGKRATCCCACGQVRVVAVTDLQSGDSQSCGCAPLSKTQKWTIHEERMRQRAQRLHDWRIENGR